jgi:hypothetical protein
MQFIDLHEVTIVYAVGTVGVAFDKRQDPHIIIDSLIVDARTMPLDIQIIAYEKDQSHILQVSRRNRHV